MRDCMITSPSQTLNNWIKRNGLRLDRKKDLQTVKFVKHRNSSLREYHGHFLSGQVKKKIEETQIVWLTLGMGYPFWETDERKCPSGGPASLMDGLAACNESKRKNPLAQSIMGKLAVNLVGRKVSEEISNNQHFGDILRKFHEPLEELITQKSLS